MVSSKPTIEILLIEDHPLLRAALTVVLRDAKFLVHAAGSVKEGLARLAEHPGIVAIVMEIDLGPDGPNGFVLADAARSMRPDIGIVFLTGRPDLLEGRGSRWREIRLVKPVTNVTLVGAIMQVIARPDEAVEEQSTRPTYH